MSPEDEAHYAGLLIEACPGGGRRAAELLGLSEGQVSKFKDHRYGQRLSISQVSRLQVYARTSVFSDALSAEVGPAPMGDVLKEASEATEACADVQRAIRLATESGKPLTPRQIDDLERQALNAQREAAETVVSFQRLRSA